uniref:Aminoadipate aminotransferase n=1 Tax=Cyprinus carpio TaxID=7962 RepID=A0A8C1WJ93_CYPCA
MKQTFYLVSDVHIELCGTKSNGNFPLHSDHQMFEMLVKSGDNVLLDAPPYSGPLAASHHHHVLPAISRWAEAPGALGPSSIPRVLYTIPNEGNPTGACMTCERKQDVYELTRKYDLLITEDDPYYFLQFQKPWAPPTFLSMDVDGCVLRTDSFSKILSSGWVFVRGTASTMHTSTFTQVRLLPSCIIIIIAHIHRPASLQNQQRSTEWHPPMASVFLWIKLKGIKDTQLLIMERALEKEVLLVPGGVFNISSSDPCPYVRAAFSLSTPQQIDEVQHIHTHSAHTILYIYIYHYMQYIIV